MKTKIFFAMIGLALFSIAASAQQAAPASVNAPYAGATISDFKGKVSVQLPAQSIGNPVRGEVLPPETTVSTDDGRLLLKLSDGSDILVRPHTKLVLKQPETSGWKYFQMLMGRVRTSIQKRLGGSPAFQIGTPSAVISVRGTKFDVEVDRRGFTEVDVEEGVVELEATTGRGESVMITAGFSSRVGMETGPETPRPTRDMRPQLDRPGHKDHHDSLGGGDDDDSMKRLLASDHDRHDDGGGDHHSGGGTSGSDGGGSSSSGGSSDGGDHGSGGSDGGGQSSGSDGDHSGGDDHHHGGSRPPELI